MKHLTKKQIIFFLLALGIRSLVMGQSVTSLTLIDAVSDTDILNLTEGATINLAQTGNKLNIRANTNPSTVGSVKFGYDANASYAIENVAPYAMAGDNSGNYNEWTPSLGFHTLTVTAYSASGAGGTAGTPYTVNFEVVNETEPLPGGTGTGDVTITGELKKWHKITLTFDGPSFSETGVNPNPFLDRRLDVTFSKGGRSFKVPGYFAVDGNAGETGATSGNKWRVHFSPDETGTWNYTVAFYQGTNVAVADNPAGFATMAPMHGKTGSFNVGSSDKSGIDLRSKGRLKYVGKHHLQFAETNEYFLKGGPDAPENFLAYEDFDNTPNNGGRLKSWAPHQQDYNTGDPSWKNGKGTEIIGAINYLASEGLNVFSFLTMNISGDDQNVYPYVSSSDFLHFDISKLDQWSVVMDHAQKKGMYLHFKTQEIENMNLLDGGNVGVQRKLYYRMLIAKFSYLMALNWNLGEENRQTDQQRIAMADYFYNNDPYRHNIVLHTWPGEQEKYYRPMLGNASRLTGVSIQTNWNNVYAETKQWVDESAAAGKRWVVANDEQGGANIGVPHDAYTGTPDKNGIRKETLWGNLMASGAGVEYYFGYTLPQSDLSLQDFRSRDISWDYVRYALTFFKNNVPFWNMSANNSLVSTGWCLADEGNSYVIYLKSGGSTNLTINVNGNYSVQWFDPRNGGSLKNGSVTQISGTGVKSLGNPPSNAGDDWAILVTNTGQTPINQPPSVNISSPSTGSIFQINNNVSLTANASDQDGSVSKVEFFSNGALIGTDNTSPYSLTYTFTSPGNYSITAKATDNLGAVTTSGAIALTVQNPASGNIVYAINSGGSAYTSTEGTQYQADAGFSSGTAYTTSNSQIAGTEDDVIYRSERYGSFSYNLPVANGDYQLTLQFAEIYFSASGKRKFDVVAEGTTIIDDLDIYAQVGAHTAYDVTVPISVADGVLNIQFISLVNNTKLSGLIVKTSNVNARIAHKDAAAYEKDMIFYPNPVKDNLYFGAQVEKLVLIDIYGRIVLTKEKVSQVDLTWLKSGLYNMILYSENGSEIHKIIKN